MLFSLSLLPAPCLPGLFPVSFFGIKPSQLQFCFSVRHNIHHFPALPSPQFFSLSIFPLFHPLPLSLSLAPNIFFCLSPPSFFILPPSPRLWLHLSSAAAAAAAESSHPILLTTRAVRRLHSCHVPTKGYMAHFLISCIVGYLGSQACLLESYLYPPPPSVDCREDNLCRPCFFLCL